MAKSELAGIDKNFIQDGIIGLIVGVSIIVIGFIVPGIATIGIPSVPQSLSGVASRFIVVVFLASIFETFLFFDLILSFVFNKSKRFGIKVPFWIAAIVTSAIFAGFHFSAYGINGSSGAFISAFLIGLVFAYERRFTNSNIPGIITHMVLNWWIGFGGFVIVG